MVFTVKTAKPILAASGLLAALAMHHPAAAAPARQADKLDRGVVAIRSADGVFVSWRQLGDESSALAFNLYRNGVRLNDKPLSATSFLDAGAPPDAQYSVRPVVDGVEAKNGASRAVAAWQEGFLREIGRASCRERVL